MVSRRGVSSASLLLPPHFFFISFFFKFQLFTKKWTDDDDDDGWRRRSFFKLLRQERWLALIIAHFFFIDEEDATYFYHTTSSLFFLLYIDNIGELGKKKWQFACNRLADVELLFPFFRNLFILSPSGHHDGRFFPFFFGCVDMDDHNLYFFKFILLFDEPTHSSCYSIFKSPPLSLILHPLEFFDKIPNTMKSKVFHQV